MKSRVILYSSKSIFDPLTMKCVKVLLLLLSHMLQKLMNSADVVVVEAITPLTRVGCIFIFTASTDKELKLWNLMKFELKQCVNQINTTQTIKEESQQMLEALWGASSVRTERGTRVLRRRFASKNRRRKETGHTTKESRGTGRPHMHMHLSEK